MQKQKNKSPEIRFKKYTDAWEQRRLGEMYDIVSGYAFKMSDYVQSGVPIINGESIQHGSISTKNLNFLPEEFLDKYQNFILNTGDIVLGLNRPITNGNLKIAQVPKDLRGALLYQRAGKIIILNNSNINFSYQLLGKEVSKFVLKEAVGSDQPFISTTKLKKWLIYTPVLEKEQTKIGNFFDQLDHLITLHQRKLEILQSNKKSLLQKMFPKKGEEIPEVRFPGFTDAWDQRKLGEFLKEFSIKSKSEDEYTVLSSTNSGMEVRDGRVSGASNLGYKIIEDGDLVLSPQNLWLGNINVNDIGKGLVSPSYRTFKFVDLDRQFIEPQLRIPRMLEEYKNSSTQGASVVRRNLELESFYQIPIRVPNWEEQKIIGFFFKQLDNTITLHQRKLETLKEYKKTMLQKMFI